MARSILLTGGCGFLGSHLAEDFQRRGWQVTIVDDRRAAVADWTPHPDMKVIDASVEDYCSELWVHLPGDQREFDLVVHAASPVGPAGILGLAGDIIPAIVEPTRAITDACARSGNLGAGTPLIHISTSEVYNSSGVNSEDDDLIAPAEPCARGEYAVGKIAAEYIVRQRARLDGFPALVIRPFNIAGARQPREKGFVVPTFVEQALAGEPLTVFGAGDQRRSFMSVADFCRLIAVVSERSVYTGKALNAGNPRNVTTIKKLAWRISNRVGRHNGNVPTLAHVTGNSVHGPEWREAAGYHKVPQADRAKALLGWEPQDDLDAIIDATADELAGVAA